MPVPHVLDVWKPSHGKAVLVGRGPSWSYWRFYEGKDYAIVSVNQISNWVRSELVVYHDYESFQASDPAGKPIEAPCWQMQESCAPKRTVPELVQVDARMRRVFDEGRLAAYDRMSRHYTGRTPTDCNLSVMESTVAIVAEAGVKHIELVGVDGPFCTFNRPTLQPGILQMYESMFKIAGRYGSHLEFAELKWRHEPYEQSPAATADAREQ